MKSPYRAALIILVIFLSGLAFAPYVAASSKGFDWQRFALAYDPQDIGFRPKPHGYSFDNYISFYPGTIDFTIEDAKRMLGENAVCYMIGGICFEKPRALMWVVEMNWKLNFGKCYGMSVTSLRFFKEKDYPWQFEGGASVTYDLDKENVRRHLAYYQTMQYVGTIKSEIEQAWQNTPSGVLNELSSHMSGDAPNPVILIIKQGDSAHAVTPYAIEDRGGGVFWVWVYDNNDEGDDFRYVYINKITEEWNYFVSSSAGSWSGNETSQSIGFVPMDIHSGTLHCDWCNGNSSISSSMNKTEDAIGEIWSTGNNHLLITDTIGRRIGFVGDDFVDEIPGAYESIYIGGLGIETEPIYTLPLTDAYTILIDGQPLTQTETVSVTQFGPGYAASADGINLTSSSKDELIIAPDGTHIAYHASDSKEPTLTLTLENSSENYQFQILDADIGTGQVITLTVDTVAGQLLFNNSQNNGGIYGMTFSRLNTEGEQKFSHYGLDVAATDSHFIDYSNWDGSGSMTVYVDRGSDGSIDETKEIMNQFGLLFFPVITK